MKKLMSISLLIMVMLLLIATTVNATTNSELPQKLYSMGSKYGMTSADKVKIERYLADYPVTEEQANKIVAKAEEAVKVMEDAGVTNVSKLNSKQLDKIKSIANEAATIVDVTLKFKKNSVEIYKDGKLIEEVTSNTGKLAYTGNNVNAVLAVSSVTVIALATVFVVKKKFANA